MTDTNERISVLKFQYESQQVGLRNAQENLRACATALREAELAMRLAVDNLMRAQDYESNRQCGRS